MITNKDDIADIVHDSLYDAYKTGIIPQSNKDISMDMLYSFSLHDIHGVYIYKQGVGDGTWFLLKDGSIWSADGFCEQDANSSDYR